MRLHLLLCLLIPLFAFTNCRQVAPPEEEIQTRGKPLNPGGGGGGGEDPPPGPTVDYWLTKGDQSVLLQQQPALGFGTSSNRNGDLVVDSTQLFQTVDGFGYTLTTGSAYLINRMNAGEKSALLEEIFGSGSGSIGVSYLRVNIGASDLSPGVYSYDDLPAGQSDPTLQQFSLAPDEADVIPVLQQILAINPSIKILGSPWSPPTWMKDNHSSIGGSLLPQYYTSFANYLVKYIQGMQANGIPIDAITIQNEPLHDGNNPSMYMAASVQAEIIKNHLGPALQSSGLATKIILYDHNCDHPDYPLSVLDDVQARNYVDGSAFHLYAGDISALTTVHDAYPGKQVYFTEQYTASNGNFGNDLKWHLKNVITGSMRNWSRTALEWNLANDPDFSLHTPGGCTTCRGAVTIDNSSYSRNVAYYIIAHASKFVPPGSVRIASTQSGSLYNVAFLRPDGKKVLIVENDGHNKQSFNLRCKDQWAVCTLNGGDVATYIW